MQIPPVWKRNLKASDMKPRVSWRSVAILFIGQDSYRLSIFIDKHLSTENLQESSFSLEPFI